jgi:hypothetical protein
MSHNGMRVPHLCRVLCGKDGDLHVSCDVKIRKTTWDGNLLHYNGLSAIDLHQERFE